MNLPKFYSTIGKFYCLKMMNHEQRFRLLQSIFNRFLFVFGFDDLTDSIKTSKNVSTISANCAKINGEVKSAIATSNELSNGKYLPVVCRLYFYIKLSLELE